jgi:phenylacetate-CoA ligase
MTPFSLAKDLFLTAKGFLTFKLFLSKSQFWSRDKIHNYQFRKLKRLLIEAYEGTEYYKGVFDKISFNPYVDFNKLEDIKKLPILSKAEAISNREKLINKKFAKRALALRTSGSTGNPFEILVSPDAWVMEQAVVWRHWSWGGYRFRDPLAMIRSFAPESGKSLIKHDPIKNFTYYSPFHLSDENIQIYLDDFLTRKVTVLRGYPSSISTIAEYVIRKRLDINGIKMILTASEVLTEDEKNLIKKAFKANVYNHYGLAEVCIMMGSCKEDNGLHNYDEYGYCEIIESENGKKRLIGTNLHNLAMPLIRYDTGDLVEVDWETCSCSRSLPTVKNIIGRKDNNILTKEGFKIPTVNFYTMFEKYAEIHSWQIVQYTISDIKFIIKSDQINQNRIVELKSDILLRIPHSLRFEILLNQPFVKFGEGKKNAFVSFLNK